MKSLLLLLCCLTGILANSCKSPASPEFQSNWAQTSRYWVGPEYWANRLQDWKLQDGSLLCIGGQFPRRSLQLMTYELAEATGDLQMKVRIQHVGKDFGASDAVGFLIGSGKPSDDYRRGLLSHNVPGPDAGFFAGVNGQGELIFREEEEAISQEGTSNSSGAEKIDFSRPFSLSTNLSCRGDQADISLLLIFYNSDGQVDSLSREFSLGEPDQLSGTLALLADGGAEENGHSFRFSNWEISGSLLKHHPDRSLGPVVAAQHTIHNNILKLTAQMVPIGSDDPQNVALEILQDNNWKEVARARIERPGFFASFRVTQWNTLDETPYRIVYQSFGENLPSYYEGTIRTEPDLDKELVVAGFTGNNQSHGSIGGKTFPFNRERIWFPHEDLSRSVAFHQADLLFFSGDQIYEGRPTWPDRRGGEMSELDYLYKWYLFLWSFRDLMRDIPSVCMPDDHDVYHGNVWGNGGSIPDPNLPAPPFYPDRFKGHWIQDQGGYRMGREFVQLVDRTQTSHLPDPYSTKPIANGIGTYYTGMTYGGVSFAIIEDRKFKSSPTMLIPDAHVINGFSQIKGYPAENLDVTGAVLLGEAQLEFIDKWTQDWAGAWMKTSLSQTIFANVSTYPDTFLTDAGTPQLLPLERGIIPKDYSQARDMDSNGWPQTGRNKALKALRKGFTFMYAGDQHLGTLVHHGVEEWEDAGYSFCVPSVANLWPRRWFPSKAGENHQTGMPNYTGRYRDGFGNLITVWAASNPYVSHQKPAMLHDRAPGYGIVRFDKKAQQITVECWPRYVDPAKEKNQYPGWPYTLNYTENYGRKPLTSLGLLSVEGLEQLPVILVYDEADGSFVYGRRMQAFTEKIGVFQEGEYKVMIGEPGQNMKSLEGLESGNEEPILVRF